MKVGGHKGRVGNKKKSTAQKLKKMKTEGKKENMVSSQRRTKKQLP